MDTLLEAREQYRRALRLGQKQYRDRIRQGLSPHPAVLDEILSEAMVAGKADLGVMEIPADRIVGTVTGGRISAFSAGFLPLLESDTEFALKWTRLCQAHLGDEGIRDAVRCYEYMGRFYVQEGNKRVSVLKSYGAPTVPGHVLRIIPVYSQAPEVRVYYEFLQFYPLVGLYQIQFTRPGSFPRLQAAMGFAPDHAWTQEERRRFLAGFTYFREAFEKRGGSALPVTAADALLVWLAVYPFEDLRRTGAAELQRSLGSVWSDVKLAARDEPIAVATDPLEPEQGVLGRLLSSVMPVRLQVAFINEKNADTSPWVRTHERGRRDLEELLGERVTVRVYSDVSPGGHAEAVMEQAVAEGARVLFATTAPLIGACRRIAARYPEVKVLNCSISQPYAGVRTYYSRIYEGKFISGAIAGAMCREDRIGYVASFPIFGIPAAINAFALGAQLTNPGVRVKLRWSCLPGDPMAELMAGGVKFISTLDITDPEQPQDRRGACMVRPDGSLHMVVSPFWNWGAFYVRIVRSILDGSYDAAGAGKTGDCAVNYWWGIGSGVIGLKFSQELPAGVRSLAEILHRGIADGSVSPFHRELRDQEGVLRSDGSHWFTPAELLGMDWLCDRVEGSIPGFDRLVSTARPVVRAMGVYRDRIAPEKED